MFTELSLSEVNDIAQAKPPTSNGDETQIKKQNTEQKQETRFSQRLVKHPNSHKSKRIYMMRLITQLRQKRNANIANRYTDIAIYIKSVVIKGDIKAQKIAEYIFLTKNRNLEEE